MRYRLDWVLTRMVMRYRQDWGINENGDEIQTRLVLTRMVMRYRQDWY